MRIITYGIRLNKFMRLKGGIWEGTLTLRLILISLIITINYIINPRQFHY
jgi:hypothetical protein